MEQRRVGRSGLLVSHLGLGTWRWGSETDEDDAADQLISFHEAGGTLVDTGTSYSAGRSEEILGRLLGDVIPREELVIATKAGLRWRGEQAMIDASRGALLRQLDLSLRRLGIDHVDLWQLHVPDDEVPIEETLAALDAAVHSGKVRYVGVSNFTGWQTAQAATWQRCAPGRLTLVSNQVRYSLLDRGIEREVLPACDALGVGVLPFSPLGGGVLTGKYRDGVPADSRAARGGRHLAPIQDPTTIGIVEAVSTAAEGLATSAVAVALAWVRDRPGVTAPIVGARTLGQLTAALGCEMLDLPEEISQALDDVSAPRLSYRRPASERFRSRYSSPSATPASGRDSVPSWSRRWRRPGSVGPPTCRRPTWPPCPRSARSAPGACCPRFSRRRRYARSSSCSSRPRSILDWRPGCMTSLGRPPPDCCGRIPGCYSACLGSPSPMLTSWPGLRFRASPATIHVGRAPSWASFSRVTPATDIP